MQVQVSQERAGWALPGIIGLAFVLVPGFAGLGLLISNAMMAANDGASTDQLPQVIGGVLLVALASFVSLGFVVLQPNQANVLVVLGSYQGTLRQPVGSGPIRWRSLNASASRSGRETSTATHPR